MKKFLALAFCSVFMLNMTIAFAGGPDAKDKAKMILAKQKLWGGKYNSALATFKEVLTNNPNDGTVLYYVGTCYFKLRDYTLALENFEKAKSAATTEKETFYRLGQLYFADAKIEQAEEAFNKFKSLNGITIDDDYKAVNVDVYLNYCANAKIALANPVDVKIENMGSLINSKYDDGRPCVTADGKKMVFSTRRPETTDAAVDVEGDGGYFEDIYISLWDTTNKKWGAAEPVPGNINSDTHDGVLSISPDGKQIFIYLNDPNGDSRGGDIYVSKVSGNKWKTPEPLNKPVNTSYWEGGACLSPDGKTLFFASENPKFGKEKGFGKSDIWMVERISKTEWGKPVNLGAEVNTEFQEDGIFLAPDGKTLFFRSNNRQSIGDYDIFKTVRENGKWSKPVNLGYPINTVRNDGPFVVAADPTTGYFSSDRPGGMGAFDIYKVDLSNYPVLQSDMKKKENAGLSILKGAVRDGFQGSGIEGVEVKIMDEAGTTQVASINTDGNGEYFITLKGNMKYKIVVAHKGYQKAEEAIDLPLGKNGETFSLEKQFLLNKEK